MAADAPFNAHVQRGTVATEALVPISAEAGEVSVQTITRLPVARRAVEPAATLRIVLEIEIIFPP